MASSMDPSNKITQDNSGLDSGFDSMGDSTAHSSIDELQLRKNLDHSKASSSDSTLNNVPRHGLNSMESDSNSLKDSISKSSDEGYGSSKSWSQSHDSVNCEKTQTQKSAPSSTEFYNNFLTFYQDLVNMKPDPLTWTKNDFSNKLTKKAVETAGEVLWSKEGDEDGDFEAINAARDADLPAMVFAVFMAADADVLDTKNEDRQTVLHVAAEMLDAPVVRLLMTKGADGAITDLWGNTPLHIAARFGRADVVTQLTSKIKKGELGHPRYKVPYRSLPQDNKNQMNNDGKAPVHLAAQGRHTDTLRALADAKVDLDLRRLGDGYTALHITIDNGDLHSMRALLERGADVEVKNHKGETPQQLAYLCRRRDMVDLCTEFGASPNQLLFAETEVVEFSDSEMDCSDDDDLSSHVSQMSV